MHSAHREKGSQSRGGKKEKENRAIRRSRWDTVIVNNGPEIDSPNSNEPMLHRIVASEDTRATELTYRGELRAGVLCVRPHSNGVPELPAD